MEAESLSPAHAFALLLEIACENFELMQAIIKQEIRIESSNMRASSCIQMALAKYFIANVFRARRICKDDKTYLAVDKLEQERFIESIPALPRVRNVNEHGYDVSNNRSKPSMHEHKLEGVILDETSLIVLGPEKILMGPINLFDLYHATERMRELAGFKSLKEEIF